MNKKTITDSIYIYHKNKKEILFSHKVYNWRVNRVAEGIELNKKIINSNNLSNIKNAFTTESNYHLREDLKHFNKNIEILPVKIDDQQIEELPSIEQDKKMFNNYLLRGYISGLISEQLWNIGLQRIEQLIVLLISNSLKKVIIYDNILVRNSGLKIKKIVNKNTAMLETTYVDTLKFARISTYKTGFGFKSTLSYIFQLYSKGYITDPLSEKGFKFIANHDSEIFKLYEKIINTPVVIKNKDLIVFDKNKKEFIIPIQYSNSYSNEITDYWMIQKDSYFEGQEINSIKKYPGIMILQVLTSNILPKRDLILTLELLLSTGRIIEKKGILDIKNKRLNKFLSKRKNLHYANPRIWKEAYQREGYDIEDLFHPPSTEKNKFICPVCENEDISITPSKIFCRSLGCGFKFHRKNLKKQHIDQLTPDQVISGLNNETIEIKNKKGTLIKLKLQNKGNSYSLFPEY